MEEKVNLTKEKGLKIIRYGLGGLFILLGLIYFSISVKAALFFIITGVSIFPIVYDMLDIKNKIVKIVLPIIFFIIAAMFMPNTKKDVATSADAVNNQMENASLAINESNLGIKVNETKDIEIVYTGIDKNNLSDIQFISQDDNIATFEKDEDNSVDGKIYGKLIGKMAGKTNIYVKNSNKVNSDFVAVTVNEQNNESSNTGNSTNNSSTSAELNKEKTSSGSIATKASIQTSKSATSESSGTVSSSQATKQAVSTASSSSTQTSSTPVQHNVGSTVYVTPTGKKYHTDPQCGGKNSTPISTQDAIAKGYTPCSKCAK